MFKFKDSVSNFFVGRRVFISFVDWMLGKFVKNRGIVNSFLVEERFEVVEENVSIFISGLTR